MSYVPVFIAFEWDIIFFSRICYIPDLKVVLYDNNTSFTFYRKKHHMLSHPKLPPLVLNLERKRLLSIIEKDQTKLFWSLLEKDARVQKAIQRQNYQKNIIYTFLFALLFYFSFFQ